MVLPLTCPPVRMVHRGSGAGMDTARYSKAHEDSTLPISCPSTQRADFLLLQPSRNPEQNHFLFITPRQTLSRFIGPQVLYLGLSTTRSPRNFLDASWRFKPAPCPIGRIFSGSTFGQRHPQVYTGKMFAYHSTEGVRPCSF